MGRSLSLCLTNASGFAASRWSAQRSNPKAVAIRPEWQSAKVDAREDFPHLDRRVVC